MDLEVFAKRRRELMQMMGDGAIAVLPAAPEKARNRDVLYPYRQDSDFFFLTGFNEPEAVLALVPGRDHGETILFCRERDPDKEIWDGPRVGPDRAGEMLGVDDAFPIDDIDDILPGLLEGRGKVFYTMGLDMEFDHHVLSWVNLVKEKARSGVRAPGEFVSLEHFLHEMRLLKDAAELQTMRKAARISAEAHTRAMQRCRPGMWEYEIESIFAGMFRQHNGWPAYSPIVGGGRNGCILHYIENSAQLRDGDLLLIDAGAEIDCYASDITRTFPVNGRFSGEQKAVYELVLEAQRAAIESVAPGRHWNEGHEAATRVLTQGMVDLGLLAGEVDGLIEEGKQRRFFMHRTGHWLGMDVHDVGDYKVDGTWRVLEPGMVLTVEPGLYIQAADDIDERWWNIGVRIEDDVAVTRQGFEVLSEGAPKTVAEIESVMVRDNAA